MEREPVKKSKEKNDLYLVALDALKEVKRVLQELADEDASSSIEIGNVEKSIEVVKQYVLTNLDANEYQEMIQRLDEVSVMMNHLMERYGGDIIDNSKIRRLLPNWNDFVKDSPEFEGVASAMIELILNKRRDLSLAEVDPEKLREAAEFFEAKQPTVFPQIEEEQRRIQAQLQFVEELELILEAKFTGKLVGNVQDMRRRIEKSFKRRVSDID